MQTFQARAEVFRDNELRFAPDGRTLAVGGIPYLVLDAATGSQRDLPEMGRGSWVWAFVRGGAALAHLPSTAVLHVFDPGTGTTEIHPVGGAARGMIASPDGRTLYLSVGGPNFGKASEIRALDAATLRHVAAFAHVNDYLGRFAVSGDGRRLAVSGGNWNASLKERGLTFRVYDIGDGRFPEGPTAFIEFERPVNGFALTHDGALLAVADGQGLTLWAAEGGRRVARSGLHRRSVLSVACSPTHPHLLTGDKAGLVFQWDATGRVVRRYEWGLAEVIGLAFAPDGLRAAALDGTGRVVVWDTEG
ncbi:WD40 repeat domain-containing protein [Gemmata sp.]|uniref:WD40 repeat domain-containing protein n=1 Tax=Gemmata sp. TaxID=1914242 RepID=UPI003F6F8A94